MPEQREAVLQLTSDAGDEEPGKFGRANESAGIRDPVLASLSRPDSAGSRSMVFDGYRHLRRRALYPDYPGCHRYLRSNEVA